MGHYRDPRLLGQIAARIKALRQKRKITLEEFYNDTGIHLARVEASEGNLTVSTLSKICKHLGTTLDELLKGL